MPFNPKATDLETWQQATAALQIVVPYLSPLIDRLTPVPVPGIGETIACDANARVYFAPEYAKRVGLAVFAADLSHELIVHILPNHHERAAAVGVTRRDLWGKAADWSGNGTVFALAEKHPGAIQPGGVSFKKGDASRPDVIKKTRWVHPSQGGHPDGLLAEDYYSALLAEEAAKEEAAKEKQQQQGNKQQQNKQQQQAGGKTGGKGDDNGQGTPDENEQDDNRPGSAGNGGVAEGGRGSPGDSPQPDGAAEEGSGSPGGDQGAPAGADSGTGRGVSQPGQPGGAPGPDGTDPKPGAPGAGHGRCGSCATGGDDLTTRLEAAALALYGELPGGPSPEETDSLRQEVAERVEAHEAAHGRGAVPAGIRRTVEALRQPAKVDWRKRFAVLLRDGIGAARGAADWSLRRPRWRDRIATPRLHAPDGVVALVADTSGSMGADDLRRVLTETDAVLKSGAVRELWWIPTDTRAEKPRKVRTALEAADYFVGGGGTAMEAGMIAAGQIRPRPHLVVVVTDGETNWPAEPPPGVRRVLIVLTRRPSFGAPIPAWATVAHAFTE